MFEDNCVITSGVAGTTVGTCSSAALGKPWSASGCFGETQSGDIHQ